MTTPPTERESEWDALADCIVAAFGATHEAGYRQARYVYGGSKDTERDQREGAAYAAENQRQAVRAVWRAFYDMAGAK